MANRLTQLLGKRDLVREQNLERGRIFVWAEGNEYTRFQCGICWQPPGTGCIVLEIWGASGSGSRMCCCAMGMPGNPGAYVKKCLCVCPDNVIFGQIGKSCGNADNRCFRGCSEATCICWSGCAPYALGNRPMNCARNAGFGPMCRHDYDPSFGLCCEAGATAGCLCAKGGRAGITICQNDYTIQCCYGGRGLCLTPLGASQGCVLVCNICRGSDCACAYGGDVNCTGHFSCTSFYGCKGRCVCHFQHHVATSAGVFSDEGVVFSYTPQSDSREGGHSGGALVPHNNALDDMSRQPSGHIYNECWGHSRACGCYEAEGCIPYVPYGVPGFPAQPCPNVRDHGGRGGQGAVRIKYIGTNSYCAYS